MKKGNISDKFDLFSEHWSPKIIAELNGQHVKLAKLKGDFIWHSHEHEDELFLVHKGSLKIEFRDRTEILNEGDFIAIPRGIEHRPIAEEEVEVILFEPATTINTGGESHDLTKNKLEKL